MNANDTGRSAGDFAGAGGSADVGRAGGLAEDSPLGGFDHGGVGGLEHLGQAAAADLQRRVVEAEEQPVGLEGAGVAGGDGKVAGVEVSVEEPGSDER
jgi:hypothetical protein